MCVRTINGENVLDFTTYPKPLGHLFTFDTTCPSAGQGYIVKENLDGTVEACDPRDIDLEEKATPPYAWFATHWEIVRQVFSVPVSPWKQASTWLAGIMVAAMFVLGLAVL